MRLGFISDLHGSIKGLRQAQHAIGKVDRLYYLGDVVGYGSQEGVDDCIEHLRDLQVEAIRGNCEEYLGYRFRSELNPESLAWIADLPIERTLEGGLYLCHGGPKNTLEERVISEEGAWFNFKAHPFRLCFHGHTHVATLFEADGDEISQKMPMGTVSLDPGKRYLVGVGSAGSPRDGRLGSAVIFDGEAWTLTFLRF